MLRIVITVFDAFMLFIIGWVGFTASDRKNLGVSLFMEIIFLMNLLYIWGVGA